MRSNIQANIPPRITITPKENIPGLTGTVIEPKYHLSISDYQQFNTSVNGVIDVLNNINYYHSNLDFLSVQNLTNGLNELISSCFICITSLNGQPITEETRNINVLKRFTINGQKYMSNEQNYGNITLPDRYISGYPSSFVESFNGRYGNVSGAIEQVKMNGNILTIVDGVVDLVGLVKQDKFVSKINNKTEDIYLVNKVKVFSDLTLSADNVNKGKLTVSSTYFVKNTNNTIPSNILLSDVDQNNDKTAITRAYLKNFVEQNSLIGISRLASGANPHWLLGLPLHCYKGSTGELLDLDWEVVGRSDQSPGWVYVRFNDYPTGSAGLQDITITYMKGILE